MPAFKLPDHNERALASRQAKERALQKLRDKPAADPALIAEREAARSAREAALAEKQAARRAAIAEEKRAREEARAAAQAAKEAAELAAAEARRPAPPPNLPTAAELKAARDARYAARKARRK
jgi:hypothetical protein